MKTLLLPLCIAASLTVVSVDANAIHKHLQHHAAVPFSAKSFIVASDDGTILSEQESNIVRPIASISKLMVGLLTSEQDMDEVLTIPLSRQVQSGIPRDVRELSRYELLTLALVKSDNFAAQILCANLNNCVERMNQKAVDLGMVNTHYEEPTGLNRGNVSTAHDLLKLVLVASSNSIVTSISSMPSAEIIFNNRRSIKIHNTNPLTSSGLSIFLSKTGFTNPAGGCILYIIGNDVKRRIIILLGSHNTHTRITESLKLYKESIQL